MFAAPTFNRRITPLAVIMFWEVFLNTVLALLVMSSVTAHDRIALYGGCIVFPYLCIFLFAGYAADHCAKRVILILVKLFELFVYLAGAFFLSRFPDSVFLTGALLCLISFKTAFFMPALYGILPETFPEQELSQAAGRISGVFFLGIALTFPVLELYRWISRDGLANGLIISGIFAFVGLVAAFLVIPSVSAIQKKRELAYKRKNTVAVGMREVFRTPSLLLTSLGDGFFLAVGAALLYLIWAVLLQPKAGGAGTGLRVTMMIPVLGMALGCRLAGRFSRKKIELGLIPIGAFLVALALPLAALFHGEPTVFTLTIPRLYTDTIQFYIPAMFYLLLAGIGGGLFIIPLRAYFLHRVHPEATGAATAVNSVLGFTLLFLVCGVIMRLIPLPYVESAHRISPYTVIIYLGVIVFLVTLFSMWILPDFALRFLIIAAGNTLYRTKIRGAENIPERGGVLLLSNHISFIDSILISACTSRRIRFLMHEDYFRFAWLRPVAKLTGFIRVPTAGKDKMNRMFAEVREALRKGDVICAFPEGHMTRNGVLGHFRAGYERMLPDDMEIPVIPVWIGNMWGSLFSYVKGTIALRLPREFPYNVMVSFGKPMVRPFTPFDVRQAVADLAAEGCMDRIPKERTLHYSVLRDARTSPFRIRLRDYDGTSYTLLQAVCTAVLFSRKIRRHVSSETEYTGILLPNSSLEAIAILSVLYADKAPAILNHTVTPAVFEASVKKAGVTHILTTREYAQHCPMQSGVEFLYLDEILKEIPGWKRMMYTAAILLLPYRELINLISPLSADRISGVAALLFSSGSTGNPKAVMLTHHNMYTNAIATGELLGVERNQDHVVGNLPLFHSFGLNTGFWMPMLMGFEVTYVDNPLDTAKVETVLRKYKPTLLYATPSFLQIYLRKCPKEAFQSLRLTVTGAEKLRSGLIEKFKSALDGRLEIMEAYGCTELSPMVSMNLAPQIVDLGKRIGKNGSIGVPLNNIAVRVLDPLTKEPLPPESEGILHVKGSNVMRGYLGDPELTAKAVQNGYYDTGDVVKMDEKGYLTICGRLSRFSKIAGEMVPHEMVEHIINELACPEGRGVAVCGIPDPAKGEALLVLYTGEMKLTPADVVAELRERSISNLWIPKAVNFHAVETLPLLGSGKLDLVKLQKMANGFKPGS